MAKIYKKPSIVSGKSISDILNMDIKTFNSLGKSDLQKVVGRLVSAGNKRIRTFEKHKESSPAIRYIMNNGGKFSTRGKDLNALRSEFFRAKSFLESKTSTRKKWNDTKQKVIDAMNKQGVNMTRGNFEDIWKAYEELKELSPEVATRGLKYTVLKDIADMVEERDLSAEDIVFSIRNRLDKIYEEKELEDYDDGISEFFEF